jgi:Uma2 family endonuclease
MTVALPVRKKPQQVQPYRWTRQEYEKMTEIGLFSPEARLELIEGEILEMAAHTSYHAAAIALVQRRLDRIYGIAYHVRAQLPLAATDDSEPEPDIAVVVGQPEDYWHYHPTTALLIVEVAYSSLEHDQERKRRLYARCQIPEYWILNLNERQLEVYREPQNGDYQSILILQAGATIAPLSYPDHLIDVADLLPR